MSRKTDTHFKLTTTEGKNGKIKPKIESNSGRVSFVRLYDTASGHQKIKIKAGGQTIIRTFNTEKKKRKLSDYNLFMSKAIKKDGMTFAEATAAWKRSK